MKVNYNDIYFVWISNYYDEPLHGICKYKNKLYEFIADVEEERTIYRIINLTLCEKIRWKARQKLFEIFVGTHWTMKENKRHANFGKRRPKWFWDLMVNFYYKFLSTNHKF